MRLLVLTNSKGDVVATARITQSDDPNAPFGGRPVPGEGHQLHEITLPPELHHIRSAQELHGEVARLLKKTRV